MLQDQETKKSIYASVIASVIFLLLVQPILKIAGKVITWIGENIYHGISKAIYKSAAVGINDKFSFELLLLATGLMAGVATGIILIMLGPRKSNTFNNVDTLRTKMKKSKIFMSLILVLLFLNPLFLLTESYSVMQMNASFSQRLIVLEPHLDGQKVKEIRAQWAQMKSRADYITIVKTMEDIAAKVPVELPPLLWK